MSYYANGEVHWLPRLNVSEVAQFEFDAYNFWSETFFRELLNALGVQQVLSIKFRDRSMESEFDDIFNLREETAGTNVSTWIFSEVPRLQYFKYESTQRVLNESIFHAFDNLTTLELRLAVRHLPSRLFASIAHSLQILSIWNPQMFHFEPALLDELQQLRNLSLKLAKPPEDRVNQRLRSLFISMQQLEELRLSRANSHVNATMLKGSYNLRLIGINHNPELTELPSELFVDQGNLTLLDLSCNGLLKLPTDLFNGLVKLTVLDLSSNRLTSLSRWVPIVSAD